jgi:hypothetical protein
LRNRAFPACLAGLALACLLLGGWVLAQHRLSTESGGHRAAAGLWLVLLGAVAGCLAVSAWQRRAALARSEWLRSAAFWKWQMSGPVLCYLACLVLGPRPYLVYQFLALLATWYVAAAAVLIVPAGLPRWLGRSAQLPLARRAGRAAFLLLLLALATEISIRAYSWLTGDRLLAGYVARTRTLPPGIRYGGRTVNNLGFWDEPFQAERRPGVLRIVALGDGAALCGSVQTNYLEQVERQLPGVEIYNFALLGGGPREYAALLAHEAAAYQPDLVLLFLSVGDDVTDELPLPGPFDWRCLGLYQLGARMLGSTTAGSAAGLLEPCRQREEYLRQIAGQFSVCRTPIDERMRRRWRATLRHLDDMLAFCRQRRIAAALVLVPGEFQVCPRLCESLRRQAGCEPGQVDLELPQRKLAQYADQRQVPLLDLLPHLRAASEPCYCRHQSSWNDQGNKLAAEVLGEWIKCRRELLAGEAQAPLGDVTLVSGR